MSDTETDDQTVTVRRAELQELVSRVVSCYQLAGEVPIDRRSGAVFARLFDELFEIESRLQALAGAKEE